MGGGEGGGRREREGEGGGGGERGGEREREREGGREGGNMYRYRKGEAEGQRQETVGGVKSQEHGRPCSPVEPQNHNHQQSVDGIRHLAAS